MRIALPVAVLMFCATTSAFAADAPTSQTVPAPDLSTPLAAVTTYFQAIDRGDVATAEAASIHDAKNEKFIEGVIAEDKAQQKYRDAAVKKFGADQRLSGMGSCQLPIDLAKQGKVHENGDVAEIGEHGDFHCRKVDGNWHLDLVRQNADMKALDQTIKYLTESAKNYADFANQVAAGNWKSLDEAEKARTAAASTPPPPPDPH